MSDVRAAGFVCACPAAPTRLTAITSAERLRLPSRSAFWFDRAKADDTMNADQLMLALTMAVRILATLLLALFTAAPETFDEAYHRLQHGIAYTSQPTGVVRMSHRVNGVEYHYVLNVPENY